MALLTDGYQTLVGLAITGAGGVTFLEREVQPPAIDGRGPIDTTTMRNVTYTTQAPKQLKKMDEMTIQVQYDPAAYPVIMNSLISVVTTITVIFPDGTRLTFPGWLDSFKPVSHKEGEFPTAEIKIIPSMQSLPRNPVIVTPGFPVGATKPGFNGVAFPTVP